jgi:hypothetical protein
MVAAESWEVLVLLRFDLAIALPAELDRATVRVHPNILSPTSCFDSGRITQSAAVTPVG